MVNVKVLATEEGDEVAQTVNNYQEIAKANTALCLGNNKEEEEEKECYAAIPDMWLIRPEHHRPQAVYQFAEIDIAGNIIGSPKYSINIPHHINSKPVVSPMPQYTKGNWEIIYVLADNSKITIHSLNQKEGHKILDAAKKMISSSQLKKAYLSKDGLVQTAEPLAQIRVKLRMIKFFSEGRKNGKPDWIAKF